MPLETTSIKETPLAITCRRLDSSNTHDLIALRQQIDGIANPKLADDGYAYLVYLGETPVAYAEQDLDSPKTAAPEGKPFHLSRMGVLADYRRQGIASYLLDQRLADARQLGCDYVWVDCLANNQPILELYRKNGFTVFHEVTEQKPNSKHLRQRLFLSKQLS